MLDIQIKNIPSSRKQDITGWTRVDTNTLTPRQKRRFQKHKDAVTAYFTTDTPFDEIAERYAISVSSLLTMAEKCLVWHEDGQPWGFRALLPGANVNNQTLSNTEATAPSQATETHKLCLAEEEDGEVTEKRLALVSEEPMKIPTILSLPDTPRPSFDDDDEEVSSETIEQAPVETVTEILAETTKLPPVEIVAEPVFATSILVPVALTFSTPEIVQKLEGKQELPLLKAVTEQAAEKNSVIESFAIQSAPAVKVKTLAELPNSTVASPISVVISDVASSLFTRSQSNGKTGPQRRIVRKRRIHEILTQTRQRQGLYRALSLVLVAIVLLGVLVPLGTGLAAYSVYANVRGVALDGVNHLLNVKNLLPISKNDPTAALDAKKLQQAQVEFQRAQADFVQLQALTDRPDILATVQEFSTDYASKLVMARHLVRVALDVSKMGEEVCGVAIMGSSLIHSSPLANGVTKPLLNASDIASIDGAIVHALYYINDIQAQMSQVHMKDVPISDKQKAQLTSVLEQLPQVQSLLTQGQGLVGLVSWLLGVGQQRRFLVQTLDRAELRPSGGFTGQYGVLQIQDGRMAPFGLRDVALLDYAGNGVELGRSAPSAYSSWMNFGNWGLRDSNLSGDYPTTARMSMQVFQDEGGGPVDGDISFTPTFIGHILDVTGPIRVAEYNETITSKNLENRLHYYQQDYSAIAVEHQKSNDSSHAARKAFTSLVGKMLLDRMRHLSTNQLLTIIKGAVKDIQSHDLEIYFANPQAEQWLVDHNYADATDSFTKQDGFAVVQANISISKASQYVHTTEHDDVALDAQGGATHNLTITLDYQQKGQVYGFDTYADYIRVYAPPNAQFLSGDGFDSGQALCNPTPTTTTPPGKGSTPAPGSSNTLPAGCSQYNNYFPSTARSCPDGNYALGDRGFKQPWAIDSLGVPTSLTSDLPGRTMWGGLTETPKNCISYITVSWYVPHAVKNVAGQPSYALMVGKQGGYIPSVELTVDTKAIKGVKPYAIKSDLNADKVFVARK